MKESYDSCSQTNKHNCSDRVQAVSPMGICKNSSKGCASVYFVGGESHIFTQELTVK